MYYRGKMFGFVHLYNGQEAVSTGVIQAMRPGEDYVCSTYRDHVHALSAGVPAREVMAELFGKATGCSKGRGGSMHPVFGKTSPAGRVCLYCRRDSGGDGGGFPVQISAGRPWAMPVLTK